MKNGPAQLAILIAFLGILAIIFVDFRKPDLISKTDFVGVNYPVAKLVSQGAHGQIYDASVVRAQQTTVISKSDAREPSFRYAPICAKVLTPLLSYKPTQALMIWQAVSLFVLSYSVFLIGKAASRINASGSDRGEAGWFSLIFFPTIGSIYTGSGDIIFGIFPLAVAYYLAVANRLGLAGFVFGLACTKPEYILPGILCSVALLAHNKPRCIAGFAIGLVSFLGLNATTGLDTLSAWLRSILPEPIVIHDYTRTPLDIVTNLPQSIQMMIPVANQSALLSLIALGASAIAFLCFVQIWNLGKSTKDEFAIVPLAMIMGVYLIPLAAPNIHYFDLCVLVMAGLIIFSFEWRKYTDWRLKSLVRVSAIAINAFLVLAFFQPQYAYPLILCFVLIVLFRRLVEAVHLAASEHEGALNLEMDDQHYDLG